MKGKAEKRYRFHVIVVTDGDRFGLLVDRKKADEAKPVYGYFWLKEPEGLGPTPIVREKCGDNCHALERAKYHHNKPKKYARFYIQERIFREILAYAKAAAESSNMKAERPLTQEYNDDDRGYPQILHRFFSADPPYELAEFLVASDIFTDCLLRKPDGKDYFVGMAEQFEVRSPNSLFPEENFDLLFTVEKVLRIERPPPARWFRDRGPMFSDFEQKKFYRREEVDVLKEKVFTNRFYLLEGKPATAKTVIVRTLMYELYKKGIRKVYYFDIAPKRHFNEVELIRDIRSTNGIFIIENIHLESRKIQWICERFANDPDRRFLLTWRKPDKEFQDPASKNLHEIDTLILEPFMNAKQLIDAYCSDPETPNVVGQKRQDILNISKKDFWLLACALQGCGDAQGQGEPLSWIANKINSRLVSLETCHDPHADQYPGIIVALSPLYKNEVLTDEKFLKKLGFTRAALNGLVERGEITWQKDTNDNVFYSLHHSSLADAYWKYGKEYIEDESLHDYEEFLYQYVISDVPNGLEAAVRTNDKTERRIQKRLIAEGKLIWLIKKTRSIVHISAWVAGVKLHGRRPACINSRQMLRILARKMLACENVVDVAAAACCFWLICLDGDDACKTLTHFLNSKKLANRLNKAADACVLEGWLRAIERSPNDWRSRFFDQLNLEKLAPRFVQVEDLADVSSCIFHLSQANRPKAEHLCELLARQELADRLSKVEPVYKGPEFITQFLLTNIAAASRLCRLLDLGTLAARLKGSACASDWIFPVFVSNPAIGRELNRLVFGDEQPEFLKRTNGSPTDEDLARKLHEHLRELLKILFG